ncbi:hypothetical protein CK203_019289 [Vitis vinifera]|uniref:Uncharacterized protein n=1 Tax=Vitis vinifera TaxID=29760 RepID=A0A438J7K9_VITVI|nr:hypothetical protein CK203_019289 [Vitis vinifera]
MGAKLAEENGFRLPEILRNLDYDGVDDNLKSRMKKEEFLLTRIFLLNKTKQYYMCKALLLRMTLKQTKRLMKEVSPYQAQQLNYRAFGHLEKRL